MYTMTHEMAVIYAFLRNGCYLRLFAGLSSFLGSGLGSTDTPQRYGVSQFRSCTAILEAEPNPWPLAVGTLRRLIAPPSAERPSSISSARLIATPALAPSAIATATNKTSREASPARGKKDRASGTRETKSPGTTTEPVWVHHLKVALGFLLALPRRPGDCIQLAP
jgi:hypothetical protein